eukprot:1033788-Amphidinium_carterae.1
MSRVAGFDIVSMVPMTHRITANRTSHPSNYVIFVDLNAITPCSTVVGGGWLRASPGTHLP